MNLVTRWIEILGVRVVQGDLGGMYGCYLKDHHAIIIERSLAPLQYRSTAMHELGHAFYGHDSTTPRTELEASEWAARQMIRWCDYVNVTMALESAQGVAHELGVLPRDVINYQAWVRQCFAAGKRQKCPQKSADAVSESGSVGW